LTDAYISPSVLQAKPMTCRKPQAYISSVPSGSAGSKARIELPHFAVPSISWPGSVWVPKGTKAPVRVVSSGSSVRKSGVSKFWPVSTMSRQAVAWRSGLRSTKGALSRPTTAELVAPPVATYIRPSGPSRISSRLCSDWASTTPLNT